MSFTYVGFHQQEGHRRFAFQQTGPEKTKASCALTIEVALLTRYAIKIQDGPAFCLSLLGAVNSEGWAKPERRVTEAEVRAYATELAAKRDGATRKRAAPQPIR